MPLIINGATSGATTLTPTDAITATLTLPSSTGTLTNTSQVFGIGQTWQNVYSSRNTGTVYTNSTGKPIAVAISYTNSTASTVQGLIISGVSVYASGSEVGNGSGFCLIVPDGATYQYTTNGGTSTIVTWNELR